MKYYAILDPYTRDITLCATRTQARNWLDTLHRVDQDLDFLKLDSKRYKVGRVKAIYHYPKKGATK